MKKVYIHPNMAVINMGNNTLLAASGPDTEDFEFHGGDGNLDGEEEAG